MKKLSARSPICVFCREPIKLRTLNTIQPCPCCGTATLFTLTPDNTRSALARALKVDPSALAMAIPPVLPNSVYLVCAWSPYEMLTVQQVMKIMRIQSRQPVQRHLMLGHFPGAQLDANPERGPGRPKWLIPRQNVLEVLQGKTKKLDRTRKKSSK